MKALVVVAVSLCTTAVVAAAQQAAERPPQPIKTERISPRRPRSPPLTIPQEFSPPQEAYASFPAAPGAAAIAAAALAAAPSACRLRLAKIAVFKPLPVLIGPGECGADDAVLLEKVVLPGGADVAVVPPATLRCTMAEAVALWLRQDVAAAALALGAPLRGLDDFDSYECRGRNRVRGAMLSEHGRANAIDVRGFKLANGKTIGLTDETVAANWREQLRASACARFTTVLGPGSDGNHEEHIHLDLAERRGGYRICEWQVRTPIARQEGTTTGPEEMQAAIAEPVPLPRPRPAADATGDRTVRAKSARRRLGEKHPAAGP